MRYERLWLDVPTLSQGNSPAESAGLSNDWCGRTSSCMVHNYVKRLEGETAAFIVNNQSDSSKPYDLIYPDGSVAAEGYMLGEPLETACSGWGGQQYLYPECDRGSPVDAERASALIAPVIDSLERSVPVVAYTGISLRSAPTHIVVISGYERSPDGSVWLLIDDPSVLDEDKETRIGSENLILAGSEPDLSRGVWASKGARYWIRALRLFEPNDWSTDDDDLWCDHASRSGFAVFLHNTASLDPSHTHTGGGVRLPLDLGAGLELTEASVAAAHEHVEREHDGGYYPLGANTIWHGGVHLHAEAGSPVFACAEGVIVAARATSEDGEFGSRSFVLVQHGDSDPERWYSLYAHLGPAEGLAWRLGADGAPDPAIDNALAGGAVASLTIPVAVGEQIGVTGSYGLPPERHDLIHFEVFSAENLWPNAPAVEDSDGDLTVDADEIFDLVEQEMSWEDPAQVNLDAEEVRRFYAEDPRAPDLRGVACRFVSEWGVDPDEMVAGLEELYDTEGLAEQIAPYLWWDEAPAEHLPADRRVWHYNPIEFLARRAGVGESAVEEEACVPGVARGRIEGALFDSNKTLLLPGAIEHMRGLKRYYDEHPGGELLVVGHADRSGDAAYNLQLSFERAQTICAFLRDDAQVWLDWYSDSSSKAWGRREDQHLLGFLGDANGPFYTGPVDGSTAINDAVERFQNWSNAERGSALTPDGLIGPLTRAELIPAYMAADGTTLPEGTTLEAFGAGEYFPAVETADGVAEAQNRRVEVFLFPEGITPPRPGDLATPECPEYPAWLDSVCEEIEFGDHFALLQFLDPAGEPVADLEVVVAAPDGRETTHTTDAEGQVRVYGAEGDVFRVLHTSPARKLRQV